jgi:hypothetical protein
MLPISGVKARGRIPMRARANPASHLRSQHQATLPDPSEPDPRVKMHERIPRSARTNPAFARTARKAQRFRLSLPNLPALAPFGLSARRGTSPTIPQSARRSLPMRQRGARHRRLQTNRPVDAIGRNCGTNPGEPRPLPMRHGRAASRRCACPPPRYRLGAPAHGCYVLSVEAGKSPPRGRCRMVGEGSPWMRHCA